MSRRGFTIVELIIVITLMGILLALGVINLRGSQANARDTERKVDVDTIALHLETYYTSGGKTSTTFGFYPSTALTATSASMTAALRDIDTDSLTAPDASVPPILTPTSTFISATNNIQTIAGVTPTFTKDNYIYQPLELLSDGTWALCTNSTTQECRKFNLYYKLENATTECPAPNNICMITSINQ